MAKHWYVVHTYSGFEQKAKLALEERIRSLKLTPKFEEVLVPSEEVVEIKKGVKRRSSRKFFPGYILVKMDLDNETWLTVKNTSKVTGFVGNSTNPPSISDEEVDKLTRRIKEGAMKPKLKCEFEKSESVRVVSGPFATFNGTVEEVNPAKGRLKVLVSIFGRSTPIELDYAQVEKN